MYGIEVILLNSILMLALLGISIVGRASIFLIVGKLDSSKYTKEHLEMNK